ncbi:hypothetical protein [Candidatus Phytoplasma meliae]|uniref:Uncharacterized protein n=1 Tax=Candidatus Phytoplasma meliae TaxID=1848402 RepID=A0ABS5CYW5_9MOLU|nr:hypothetical protein [Candidatus Phytoplasma meliae]MBP5836165.1 hypothetical protein [Candidatus Phytoplasma meliae]MBP5836268.1 hypothetical protein [Candidatus Phytoplasma meliae]
MYNYQNEYLGEEIYVCKLSGVAKIIWIIIGISTFGIGLIMTYPLFKTLAYNRDIQIQNMKKQQLISEIMQLQQNLKQLEKDVDITKSLAYQKQD